MFGQPSVSLLCAVAVVALLTSACKPELSSWVFSGPTMGTTYTVQLVPHRGLPQPAIIRTRIEHELARVDVMASRYRADSEISRFNAQDAVHWIPISPELVKVLEVAAHVTRASNGAFNVAAAPIVDAWGFGPAGEQRVPAATELQRLIDECGPAHFEIRADTAAIRKHRSCAGLDLNAIAPGFAVDLIHDALLALGVRDFLIDVGGEVRAHGANQHGEPWQVAVEDPRSNNSRAYTVVPLAHGAIASSGGYRQYFERGGRRYTHLIDPRTGHTADAQVASVAVIASTATDADAWSTALFVLGLEDGMRVAREQRIAAFFLVWQGGELGAHATPEFLRWHALSSASHRTEMSDSETNVDGSLLR